MNRFDKIAEIWDENPRRLFLAEQIFKAIEKKIELNPQMKVADIGTGTGLLLIQILPLVGEVYGFDNSEKMLKMLDEKVEKAELSNVKTCLFDADNEEFMQSDFDLFVSSMAFHHIENIDSLLSKIYKAAAKGGKIAIADLETENGSFHTDPDDSIKHLGFDKAQFKEKVENAGFINAQVETIFSLDRENKKFPIFLATAEKK